ncbi:MAG: CBS domain-containing protein [Candidatus Marinimicrobia bacterium]|nr:CBS domain-containing protein [Candidatus Neomarinimicrobiota bacterium]|tara:strand:+ start:10438 stop:10827 length:390 start_codon:yes stop_codon:yes gene_type:complete
MKKYNIKDLMVKELITFTPETLIGYAINSLIRNKISGAPVIDRNANLVGLLSEKDCLHTLLESSYYNNLSGHVQDYMSKKLTTIDINDNINEVAQKFIDLRFRRFPVLENGKLVGQISRRDILKVINSI